MKVQRLGRAGAILAFSVLALAGGRGGTAHAAPSALLDGFYAETPVSPTYPYPGSLRDPVVAQLGSGGMPGSSGPIGGYGMSDRPTSAGVSPTVANPYTLSAASGSLTGATSTTFSITP